MNERRVDEKKVAAKMQQLAFQLAEFEEEYNCNNQTNYNRDVKKLHSFDYNQPLIVYWWQEVDRCLHN